MESYPQFKGAIALAMLFAACYLVAAEPNGVSPPSSVRVDLVPEGGALNVSWDPKGTNATTFHVYLTVDGVGSVPIGMAPASAPWFIHTGLTNGVRYTYVVVSDGPDGEPASGPSASASGVPFKAQSGDFCESRPALLGLPEFVNRPSLDVTGVTSTGGVTVEVESIPMRGGMASNRTTISDPDGRNFTARLTLAPGPNMVHARLLGSSGSPGPWSEAGYVTLDVQVPSIRVQGDDTPFENGSLVYLTTEGSTDDCGIALVVWHLSEPLNLTVTGPVFAYTFRECGSFSLTVTVLDVAGNRATEVLTVVVRPYDVAPRFVGFPKGIEVSEDRKVRVDLAEHTIDDDDSKDSLEWYASGGNASLFTTTIEDGVLTILGMTGSGGQAILHVRVSDPSGKSANGTIVVSVTSATAGHGSWALPIGLAVLGIIGAAAGGATMFRRRSARGLDAPQEVTAPFFVKGLYLIHNDGRLLTDLWVVSGGIKDPDMVSSMFTAIQDFVANSFEGGEQLQSIMFGENHLSLTRGNHVYIATVSFGPPSADYLARAKSILTRIEAEYAGVIDEWDGMYVRLQGLKDVLRPLLDTNEGRTLEDVARRRAPVTVVTKTAVEFAHGLVCYSLSLENHTDSILVDASVTVEWDKDVLVLRRVSLEEERYGNRFHLGNIAPGGSQKLEMFFDPQTCLVSFVRGVLVYTDVRGRLQTVDLDNAPVEINCPMFFTVGNANTAMLHRLVEEELSHKDNKVIRFAKVIDSRLVYQLAKAVVTGYDIKYVQEFKTDDPFIGEAWYYGETKTYNYKVVIRVTVREVENTLEFFVASTLSTTITGLLAELSHMFMMKLDERYTHGYNTYRVASRAVREEVLDDYMQRSTLYEQLVTGAAAKGAGTLVRDIDHATDTKIEESQPVT